MTQDYVTPYGVRYSQRPQVSDMRAQYYLETTETGVFVHADYDEACHICGGANALKLATMGKHRYIRAIDKNAIDARLSNVA